MKPSIGRSDHICRSVDLSNDEWHFRRVDRSMDQIALADRDSIRSSTDRQIADASEARSADRAIRRSSDRQIVDAREARSAERAHPSPLRRRVHSRKVGRCGRSEGSGKLRRTIVQNRSNHQCGTAAATWREQQAGFAQWSPDTCGREPFHDALRCCTKQARVTPAHAPRGFPRHGPLPYAFAHDPHPRGRPTAVTPSDDSAGLRSSDRVRPRTGFDGPD